MLVRGPVEAFLHLLTYHIHQPVKHLLDVDIIFSRCFEKVQTYMSDTECQRRYLGKTAMADVTNSPS